ncbi:HNH endonuclease [Thermodesulfobacteriota bacterium]
MKRENGICFSCCESKKMTEEHIIPQALGGKLSAWIFCKDCNDRFGRSIDSELIKNLHHFATALKIHRARGKQQSYDLTNIKTGTKLTFNGSKFRRKKPIVKIEKDGEKIKSIDIRARTEDELDKIISNITQKFKLGGEVQKMHERHLGPTDTRTEFVFDNSMIRRCVAKIAYGLICIRLSVEYVMSPSFDEIRSYIRFGSQNDLANANFVHTAFMTDYIRPLHKIHISLNRRKGLVFGFVCLFGTFRYTVLLSKNFKSPIELPGIDYTLDPVTSKEIFGNPNFIAPELDINDILSPRHTKNIVMEELALGFKILENYIEGHQLLKLATDD